jgi:hypothetical protein
VKRENTISVTLGRKNSGKSHYVRRRFTDHEPRLLTLDYTGEALELDPAALVVYDCAGAADTFARLLASDVREWHVIARMRGEEVARLYELLVPLEPRDAAKGVAYLFEGMAVTCDEMSRVAGLHSTPESVANALMVGRHVGLSQHYATQRPQNISGAVKGQADYVTSFAMFERHETRWIADSIGAAAADMVPRLQKFHYIEYETATGILTHRDGNDRVKLSQHVRELSRA